MKTRKYNPAEGQAFQGDVAIIPIPAGIAVSKLDEIAPIGGRLILQEGEATGHHHAIGVRHFQAQPRETGDPLLATRDPKLRKTFGGLSKPKVGIARMYRDAAVANEMVRRGILSRADLAVGCLVIEGASVALAHEEHDTIEIPIGSYLIGRQAESAGAEERIVRD